MPNPRLVLIGLGAIALVIASIYGSYILASPQSQTLVTSTQAVTINGAGATLAYPLLSLISGHYTQTHPNVQINYQPIGSVGGIKQFTVKTIDFGATYPPMTTKQRVAAPNGLHIPEAISALAISYNLPTVQQRLNLNGDVLAQIYLGNVKSWNDPQITGLNPELSLPSADINTVHQEDGDGTTFVFTSFLSQASSEWQTKVGRGTLVSFPVGLGVPTSAGVAALVSTTQNSIGYMELSYAIQSNLVYAAIQNPAGNYVAPSGETAKAAEDQLKAMLPRGDGDWSNIDLLDEPGANAYPLVTFTYIIVYKELSVVPFMDLEKAKALVDFFWYVIHDGQQLGADLQYVPLPHDAVLINEQSIRSITFKGQLLTTN